MGLTAWLKGSGNGPKQKEPAKAEEPAPQYEVTAEDHDMWLLHRSKAGPSVLKAGISVKDEYNSWMRARAKERQREAERAARTSVA
jgi:hypothetical protein